MNREASSRIIKGFQSNNEARATAGQRPEASHFPGLSTVRFPLKSVDWSLLWDDGRRREQLKFGRNSRNFDARLRDSWSTIVRLAEAELIRLSLGVVGF